MMLKKISIIAILLFFLLGTCAAAQSHIDKPSSKTAAIKTGHSDSDKKAEASPAIYLFPASVGILLMIGFGSYWLIYRRKIVNGNS